MMNNSNEALKRNNRLAGTYCTSHCRYSVCYYFHRSANDSSGKLNAANSKE